LPRSEANKVWSGLNILQVHSKHCHTMLKSLIFAIIQTVQQPQLVSLKCAHRLSRWMQTSGHMVTIYIPRRWHS